MVDITSSAAMADCSCNHKIIFKLITDGPEISVEKCHQKRGLTFNMSLMQA